MPSTRLSSLRERWLTTRNAAIFAAVAVALPAAYLFHAGFGAEQGDFVLLLALGVGVPTALDGVGPDSPSGAVALTPGVCAVVGVLFAGIYGVALSVAGQFPAAVAAFVLSYVGPALVVGSLRRRPG
ncbi:MAG: hypothetical protein V5A13_06310 [Haloarculaceae archaeon]